MTLAPASLPTSASAAPGIPAERRAAVDTPS